MSRIEWTRVSADDIEEAVSMFICRIYPRAFRVRASRGDGGIDVCVPVSKDHFDVYQVKKFAHNLTAKQKQQAKKSHDRIARYAADRGWTIDNWYLTMPLDPTNENLTWLNELANSGTFPCEWRGLSHVDGWAAAFPDVVDYYFDNGRAILNEELARFTAISGLRFSSDSPVHAGNFSSLAPSDVINGITQLRETLNKRDPHYSYDFAVSGTPPTAEEPIEIPKTLAARSVRQIGESYVTFDVHARCAESLNERPITARMNFRPEAGTDEAKDLEEFIKFGRAPRVPIPVSDMAVDMPGGLGMESSAGMVRILEPDLEQESFERRLDILSPTCEVLSSINLKMYPPMQSPDSKGAFNRGVDNSGVFEIETLTILDPALQMTLRFTRNDIQGKFPDEVEPALSMISELRPGNKFRMSRVRGSKEVDIQDIPTDLLTKEDAAHNDALLRYVRALLVIQKHTDVEIRIPKYDTLEDLNIPETLRVARLLEGEVFRARWQSSTVALPADAPDPEPGPVVGSEPLILDIGGSQVALGMKRIVLESAKVARIEIDPDGDKVVTFEPASGNDTVRVDWLDPAGAESSDSAPE
ncbi:hypothetical protein ACWDSF_17385 [Nocardia beijingensis]|uniref:hypothetical protein n=1 Tax=Nocardia beijingensis TaxID=95162 RepID=UPI00189611F6|nr:hypothetical protein [Nocardia beijingensis]MBF6079262.1 hypothetical protein [Nocardia beijingensis]